MTREEEIGFKLRNGVSISVFLLLALFSALPLSMLALVEHLYNKKNSPLSRKENAKKFAWSTVGYFWDDILALSPIILPETMGKCHNRFVMDSNNKRVVLTIDDCPGTSCEEIEKLLNTLKEHNAKCTFFCTTDYIENQRGMEDIMHRMVKEGHELGNHMKEDISYFWFNEEEFEKDLLESEKVLCRFDPERLEKSKRTRWFRPPMGHLSKTMARILEKHEFQIAIGDAYSNDPWIGGVTNPPSEHDIQYHLDFMKRKIKHGSMIIFHTPNADNRRQTVHVMKELLPFLKSKDFSVVTCSLITEKMYMDENIGEACANDSQSTAKVTQA